MPRKVEFDHFSLRPQHNAPSSDALSCMPPDVVFHADYAYSKVKMGGPNKHSHCIN